VKGSHRFSSLETCPLPAAGKPSEGALCRTAPRRFGVCVAPTALAGIGARVPALTRWASFCRASGAEFGCDAIVKVAIRRHSESASANWSLEQIPKIIRKLGNVKMAVLPRSIGRLEGGIVRVAILSYPLGYNLLSREHAPLFHEN
jgi:hypothetical protein